LWLLLTRQSEQEYCFCFCGEDEIGSKNLEIIDCEIEEEGCPNLECQLIRLAFGPKEDTIATG